MGLISAVASLFGYQAQKNVQDPNINDPNQWRSSSSWFPLFSKAGVSVNPGTSMQLSAYYGCIRNVSEDVAKLECGAYQKLPKGGKVYLPDNPASLLFTDAPNEEMIPFTFLQTIVAHVLGWGNGYAEIQRNGRGEVVALYPIHPSRVKVERAGDGRIYYRVFKVPFDKSPLLRGRGEYVDLDPMDVFHIVGLGGDGLVGYSVAKFAQDSLGTALATQTFGATFFGNGTHVGGFLEHPAQLSAEAQERLLASWNKKNQGPESAHQTNILEEGMKYNSTVIPPKDAQFVEVRQFQVVDIARWFRMPPHKIQSLEGAKFNNIEHQSIEYVQDTIIPVLVKIEQEVKRKIIIEKGVFFRFNVTSLLRGDAKARSEYYRTMINAGIMTPNEARDLEDFNPGPESLDRFYMQSAMATLDAIADGTATGGGSSTAIVPGDGSNGDALASAIEPVLTSAIERVEAKEQKALTRQAQKGHDPEWARGFFADQKVMAHSNIAAVVATYGNAAGWDKEAHASALMALRENLATHYGEKDKAYQEQREPTGRLEDVFAASIERGNNAKS